jgi:hypothetical protein
MTAGEKQLFPVRGDPERGFYAGSLPGNRQGLITTGASGDLLVAAFNAAGSLLDVTRRDDPSLDFCDDAFRAYLAREFGFEPGLIRVKAFRLPEDGLAVYPIDPLWQEFLENPHGLAFDDDDRDSLPEVIEQWNASGQFVLECCGCDFWLDGTGKVVAT